MKMINAHLFKILSVVLLLLSACSYSNDFRTIHDNDAFTVSYPSYMKATNDLTDIADLQYKNAYRNIYSIVRVQDKQSQSFHDFQQQSINVIKNFNLLENTLVTDSIFRDKERFKAIDVELYGIMDNENIYYWHSVFETQEKFYELVVWTRTMDRKQRYGDDIAKIIESFQPLR